MLRLYAVPLRSSLVCYVSAAYGCLRPRISRRSRRLVLSPTRSRASAALSLHASKIRHHAASAHALHPRSHIARHPACTPALTVSASDGPRPLSPSSAAAREAGRPRASRVCREDASMHAVCHVCHVRGRMCCVPRGGCCTMHAVCSRVAMRPSPSIAGHTKVYGHDNTRRYTDS